MANNVRAFVDGNQHAKHVAIRETCLNATARRCTSYPEQAEVFGFSARIFRNPKQSQGIIKIAD
ncbi:hypothetical protein [Cognatishimia sp. F0-27]|uniref:hypothetical protein n=1 Tax=Cognatishimia sp. F0-27 TaxID=2816855 RepID=UPI001D0CC2BB|nr:hypothetical protein [Cognatishimia sp. F0-27]MCC1491347.1 hypothetical protein [Cognatishimia sp. F0-27]